MSEINTVSLLNQMKLLTEKAQGLGVEAADGQLGFGEIFQKTLGGVNDLSQQADQLKSRFELGDTSVGIGEVMVAAQKSNLAFEATMRVRNKFVETYKDIMNMPV